MTTKAKKNNSGKQFGVVEFVSDVIKNTRDLSKGKGVFMSSAASWLEQGVEDGVVKDYTPEKLKAEIATGTYDKKGTTVTKAYAGASAVLQKLIAAGSFDANYGNTNGRAYAIIYLPGEGKKRSLDTKKKWY